MGRWPPRRPPLAPLLLAASAAAVYLNTLPAQFTFDDSFAVVRGGLNAQPRGAGGALDCVAMLECIAARPPAPPVPAGPAAMPHAAPCWNHHRRSTTAMCRTAASRWRRSLPTTFGAGRCCKLLTPPDRPPLVPCCTTSPLPAHHHPTPLLCCRGQELRSPMSHKSYRPLTVLALRLQHRAGAALLGGGPAGVCLQMLLAHAAGCCTQCGDLRPPSPTHAPPVPVQRPRPRVTCRHRAAACLQRATTT